MRFPRRNRPAEGLSVLVTAATSRMGLAIIRSLGKAGFRVIGADHELLPFGLHSRHSDAYHRYPAPKQPGLLERLIELAGETRPDLFLPTGSEIVGLTCKHRPLFEKLTAVNVPPLEGFLAAFDNARTAEECCSLGIPCPQVLTLAQAKRRLETASADSAAPTVVVKPREDQGAARGVSYCQDVETLLSKIEECQTYFGEPFLQEYIPGGPIAMRTVLVLFDRQGRLIAYFTTQKVRQWPVTGGQTALSVSTDDRELLSQVLPFFEKWRWQGPAEVELKIDPRDGKAKVIEINPRFGNYIGFPVRCGLDLPHLAALAAADCAEGRRCPTYAVGLRYVNPMLYLRAVRADCARNNHKLAVLRQVWQEVRRGTVRNSVELSDPLPRLAKAAREVSQALSSGRR